MRDGTTGVLPVVGTSGVDNGALSAALAEMGLPATSDRAALRAIEQFDIGHRRDDETRSWASEARRLFADAFADESRIHWCTTPEKFAAWMGIAPMAPALLVVGPIPPGEDQASQWISEVVTVLASDPLARIVDYDQVRNDPEGAARHMADVLGVEYVQAAAGPLGLVATTDGVESPSSDAVGRRARALRSLLLDAPRSTVNAVVDILAALDRADATERALRQQLETRGAALSAAEQAALDGQAQLGEVQNELSAALRNLATAESARAGLESELEEMRFRLGVAERRAGDAIARAAELERRIKIATTPEILVADDES